MNAPLESVRHQIPLLSMCCLLWLAPSVPGAAPQLRLRVEGEKLTVDSPAYSSEFTGARLTSVKPKGSPVEFLRVDPSVFPLEVGYANGDSIGQDKGHQVTVRQLSDRAARIIIKGNDSERELFIRLDPATGDLCILPSVTSARRGVLNSRWNVSFAGEAALVLPCVNGLVVEGDRPSPGNDRFAWPFRWNAQLAIAQRSGYSLMVHSQDTACKFKALALSRKDGLSTLGFDSEQVGPVWENRAAGGVEWRLNVYAGDWQVPARRYRQWMAQVYQLEEKRAARPGWVTNINFSLQWADANPKLLDALAKVHPPEQTLIHLSNWRTNQYDLDYPDYQASTAAAAFFEKANGMGFRVMPHFNYWACFLKHPLYQEFRDWQVRSVGRNEPEGWYWPPDTHNYTRMAYIHPGLASWRSTLVDAVRQAAGSVKAPAVFLDQTLCTWNTDNGIVGNLTTVEGLRQLQEEFAAIDPDLVLAGEGLNEISFQRQSFAQAHIHNGWGAISADHVAQAHPICSFLWQGHTRLVGYHHLAPGDAQADLGIEIYRRMGAIPTFICNDPALITVEQPVLKKLLALVGQQPRP